jgi:hypothetical protein
VTTISVFNVALPNPTAEYPATATLPRELVSADRICQRWAVTQGDGLEHPLWTDPVKSRATPLDDATAIVVDKIILKSPMRTRRFVQLWYKTPQPRQSIAKEFHMSERSVLVCWKLSLNYLHWRFSESTHQPLLALLRARL